MESLELILKNGNMQEQYSDFEKRRWQKRKTHIIRN